MELHRTSISLSVDNIYRTVQYAIPFFESFENTIQFKSTRIPTYKSGENQFSYCLASIHKQVSYVIDKNYYVSNSETLTVYRIEIAGAVFICFFLYLLCFNKTKLRFLVFLYTCAFDVIFR